MKEIKFLDKLSTLTAVVFMLLSHHFFGFEIALLLGIAVIIIKLELIYLRLHLDAETKSEEKES